MMKDLLTINDLAVEEIKDLLTLSLKLKHRRLEKKKGEDFLPLSGKNLAMIFKKSSTRTRISFEVAMAQLGGTAIYLNIDDLQMARGETVSDTARVLCRYVDGIVIRTYSQEEVEELARFSTVPVINGLTDKQHPCQILSDVFTIQEKRGVLDNLKIAYIGDGNNIANSWLQAAVKMNLNLWIACPPTYKPDADIIKEVITPDLAKQIVITNDPKEAAYQADILYTDVWASMGKEHEQGERKRAFSGFQINEALLKKAKPGALVMHCLPAHRGEEITDVVLEGEHSIVFDQAENRLYMNQAILIKLLAE